MFDKTHFNQLTSNIEKEDYITRTIIAPATREAKKLVNSMTSKEVQESMRAYGVHYVNALEAKMVTELVNLKFNTYNIQWC